MKNLECNLFSENFRFVGKDSNKGGNVTEHFNFKLLKPNAFIIENNSASPGIYYLINRKEFGNSASIKFTVTH